jgi:hypothetical protein
MVPGYIGLFFSSGVFLILVQRLFASRHALFGMILFFFIPAACLVSHFERNDRSRNVLLRSFTYQVFEHLPEEAAYYAIGDNYLFPALYYHLVEGYRPDVKLLNHRIGLGVKNPLQPPIKTGMLYLSHYNKMREPLKSLPMGLVFKTTDTEGLETREMAWKEFTDNEMKQAQAPLEKILLVDYYYRRSVYHENRDEQDQRLYCIKKMESAAEGYDQTLMLTGRAYARMEMVSKATKYFRAALAINPKNRVARFYLKKYENMPFR